MILILALLGSAASVVTQSKLGLVPSTGPLRELRSDTPVLPNFDLDSGQATKAAEYSLTDDAYAKLLTQLSERKFDLTSRELRANILKFYSDPSAAIETKRDQGRWQTVLMSLDLLRSVAPVATIAGSPAH